MNSSNKFKLIHTLGDEHIGHEARAHVDDRADVKIWLRLLACSSQIEQQIRTRLRVQFGTALPRFDYLAQLDRHPQGLKMNMLSRYLMVTGGNVTGLTDQLVKEGLVKRSNDPQDRRSYLVMLTKKGRSEFVAIAEQHNLWLAELLHGISNRDKEALYEQLGRLRMQLTMRATELDDANQTQQLTKRDSKK